jgi:GntR family transcriptional regulator/MocR family aminotransferase
LLVPGFKLDHDSSVPVYRQIAEGVRAAALDGRLTPGRRLPPTRDLARELGVNRQTVVAAYEYLASRGWAQGRAGKGTFLAGPHAAGPPTAATAGGERFTPTFSRAVDGPNVGSLLSFYQLALTPGGISFAGSYPARELMPVAAFARAMAEAQQAAGGDVLVYGPTAGHEALRDLIATRMRDAGSRVAPDDVLVTNGAQQAIELVFHTFLERGDPVVIEEPTYTGAISVLASIGARIVGVQVDEQGVRPESLAVALERHRPRLMYVQPSFHNPTTAVMGEARRREILALAARSRCFLVEDDWAAGLRFSGQDPPTLHALDGGAHVIYLSTFSKCLMPGLRVGFAVAPRQVMERLVALKQIRDCGTSPLLQAALHRFLATGGLEEHLVRVRPAYRARRDAMLEALARELPADAAWTRPEGGLFVWVSLPPGLDARELCTAARQEGVLFSSGEMFRAGTDGHRTLRLTYSAATADEIERGVATIGRLIRRHRPEHADPVGQRSGAAVPIL